MCACRHTCSKVDKGRPKVPGKVRVQFCHFCFAVPSIQNTWRKILLPPRRAAKVRADARPPAACTPARVVRGRLPTWGAGRARWQPGAPKQVFPFPATCMYRYVCEASTKSNLFRRPRLYLTHSFEGKIARGTALRSRGRSRAKRIFSCAPGRRQILSFGGKSRPRLWIWSSLVLARFSVWYMY